MPGGPLKGEILYQVLAVYSTGDVSLYILFPVIFQIEMPFNPLFEARMRTASCLHECIIALSITRIAIPR